MLARAREMNLVEETAPPISWIQPDFDGDGGFLQVLGGNGNMGLQIDGNFGAGGEPLITMYGNSAVSFDLEETGDASVVFPSSSINATETFNEAGLASRNDHATSSFAVQTTYTSVTSRTITCPSSGYILATASCEIELNHQGSSCYVTAGLSTSPTSVPNNQDLSFYLPATAGQGLYLNPSTPTKVFPVSAGNTTIHLVAQRVGTTDAVIWDAQLNLLFVPTAYGAVTLADAIDDGRQGDNDRVSRAATSSDWSTEQRESERANQDRIDSELAELRAQVDALKAELSGRNVNGQALNQR